MEAAEEVQSSPNNNPKNHKYQQPPKNNLNYPLYKSITPIIEIIIEIILILIIITLTLILI